MAAASFGTLADNLRRGDQQPPAGGRMRGGGRLRDVRIWFDAERRLRYFILAGLFGGLMAADEIPAAALLAAIALVLVWRRPRGQRCSAYCPRCSWWRPASSAPIGSPTAASSRPNCTKARRATTTGTITPTSATGGRSRATGTTRGHRPGRAVAEGLRPERAGRPSRHLQPHAGLAVEPRRPGHLDVPAARSAAVLDAAAIVVISAAGVAFYLLGRAASQLRRHRPAACAGCSGWPRYGSWRCCRPPTCWPGAAGPAAWAWCCWPSPSSRPATRPGTPGRIPG